jgi:hypothetical protein
MTTFWRDGHRRTSQSGYTHWVEGHWVERDAWEWHDLDRESWVGGWRWTRSRLDDGVPNSKCPRCGSPVWFYRNPNGGCAYFDELGKPWPKHPCMDTTSVKDRTAVWQAAVVYREEYKLREPDGALQELEAAYDSWQEVVRSLHERAWEWDIEAANDAVEMALDQLLKRSRTSASARKKRERWTKARRHAAELKTAYQDARKRARITREEYLQVLHQHHRPVTSAGQKAGS